MLNSEKKPDDSKKFWTQEEFDNMLREVFGPSRVVERKVSDKPQATNKYEVRFLKFRPKK